LEELSRSERTLVLRCRHKRGHTVIVKTSSARTPDDTVLATYKREHDLLQNLQHPGVIKTEGLLEHNGVPLLILEDIQGQPLTYWHQQRPMSVVQVLRLLIEMASILEELHAAHYVHHAISLDHFIWNPDTDALRLLDFSACEPLVKGEKASKERHIATSLLPTMAPEQTGRIDLDMDHRADLYSLGASAYILLTGVQPFTYTEPNEQIIAHLAEEPASPALLNPTIPSVLSQLLLLLLAKQPEERYQSATGLLADLTACLQAILTSSPLPRTLRTEDRPLFFSLPQTLYGREEVIAHILSVAEQSKQNCQLFLLKGPAGIGKTSIAQVVRQRLSLNQSFAQGNFEKQANVSPYKAIFQAIGQLFRDALTEDGHKLQQMQAELLHSLGSQVDLLVACIPETKHLLPNIQPPPSDGQYLYSPGNDRYRVQHMFQALLQSFNRVFGRVALFLDDLQWADQASLSLLTYLLQDIPQTPPKLLILGAYRDEALIEGHPLLETIASLKQGPTPCHIELIAPLTLSQITQMVQDTCYCPEGRARQLASLLHQKTAGLPFSIRSLLEHLHDTGIIAPDGRGWSWDEKQLQHVQVTENVLELLAKEFDALPEETRSLLALAACIGHRFQVDLLSVLSSAPANHIMTHLRPAQDRGLLVYQQNPKSQYTFAHNKIEEIASACLSPQDKAKQHLTLARDLQRALNEQSENDDYFLVAHHFEKGSSAIVSLDERIECATLCLQAGKRARKAGALERALQLYELGLQVLGERRWKEAYAVTLPLCCECAQLCHTLNQDEQLEQYFQEVIKETRHLSDQTPVWEAKMRYLIGESRSDQAIRLGLDFFHRAGKPIKRISHPLRLLWHFFRVHWKVRRLSAQQLQAYPNTDKPSEQGIQLMQLRLITAIVTEEPKSAPGLLLQNIQTSLRQGLSAYSPLNWFLGYCLPLCSLLGQRKRGQEVAEAILDNASRLGVTGGIADLHYFLHLFISSHSTSLNQLALMYEKDAKYCMEQGETEQALRAMGSACSFAYNAGYTLPEVDKRLHLLKRALLHFPGKSGAYMYKYTRQAVDALYKVPSALPYIKFTEKEKQEFQQQSGPFGLIVAKTIEIQLHLVFREYKDSFQYANELIGKKELSHPMLTPLSGLCMAYICIALSIGGVEGIVFPHVLQKKVKKLLKQLKKWSDKLPASREHFLLWAEAAFHQHQSKPDMSLDLYKQAYLQARRENFRQSAALIAEQMAGLSETMGEPERAKEFLHESFALYKQWGAKAKVRQLKARYLYLQHLETGTGTNSYHSRQLMSPHASNQLLQLIPELEHEKESRAIVQKLLQSLLRHTGANQAKLLHKRGGDWIVVGMASNQERSIQFPEESVSMGASASLLPYKVLRFVAHTREWVLLEDASQDVAFSRDTYIKQKNIRSLLCAPLLVSGELTGAILLENHLTKSIFSNKQKQHIQQFTIRLSPYLPQFVPLYKPTNEKEEFARTEDGLMVVGGEKATNIPTQCGDWMLLKAVGEGGMSQVFQVVNERTKEMGALKLLKADLQSNHLLRQRFWREAEILGTLNHPNIASSLDNRVDGSSESLDYIVLEWLEGRDMREFQRRYPQLPVSWLLDLTEQLCGALSYAHEKGIVHRDIKPANIFLVEDSPSPRAKLLDFGIAKRPEQDGDHMTATGVVVGTPAYLAPEQLQEKGQITPMTDIYSLGVLWFQALAGVLPFQRGAQVELLLDILQMPAPMLGSYRPEFADTDLEDLLVRMLSKDPYERPSSAELCMDEFEMACQLLEDPLEGLIDGSDGY
jgi:serine/threonine protein kinase